MNATEKWTPPRRRRVYLVRHGEVRYFDAAGNPLRPDQVPLTDEGRRQAQLTAESLGSITWDRVITSGLPRTIETAQLLLGNHPHNLERHEQLQEIRPGKFGMQSPEEVAQAFLPSFSSQVTPEATFLGGETYGAFLDRVLPWWDALLADGSWSHVLIVAHGGVNRAILGQVLGLGFAGFGKLEQDPCGINLIEVEPTGHAWVRLLNSTVYDLAKVNARLTTMEQLYEQYRIPRQG